MSDLATATTTTSSSDKNERTPWKDSLFYWCGTIELQGEEDDNGDDYYSVVWTGRIVEVTDCPDARRAPVPTERKILKSESSLFSLEGRVMASNFDSKRRFSHLANLPQEKQVVIAMSSCCNDDNDNDDDDEGGNEANEHTLVFCGGEYSKYGQVFGKGHDKEYGCHFIEVGRIHGRELMVARRYLADPQDDRIHWSITTLQSHLCNYGPPLVEVDAAWHHILNFCGREVNQSWRHPWRSLAFHSACWKQPALRNPHGVLLKCAPTGLSPQHAGPPQPLIMPGSSCFRLRLSPSLEPDLDWEDQCWGCGGSLGCDNDDTRHFEIGEWTRYSRQKRLSFGEYCDNHCIAKAAPELARWSSEWKRIHHNRTNLFLIFKKSSSAIDYFEVCGFDVRLLEIAGWTRWRPGMYNVANSCQVGDWILKPDYDPVNRDFYLRRVIGS